MVDVQMVMNFCKGGISLPYSYIELILHFLTGAGKAAGGGGGPFSTVGGPALIFRLFGLQSVSRFPLSLDRLCHFSRRYSC